jgi:hypothetical protein
MATSPQFADLCKRGEAADLCLRSGEPAEAIAGYQAMIDTMFSKKSVDSFIMGKCALGLMLALIKKNDPEAAGAIWLSDQRHDRREEIGLLAITRGQTSVHDLMIYFMLCAYFHSMSAGDKPAALQSIHRYMGKVADYAFSKDTSLLPCILNNWLFCLTHLFFPAPIPDAALEQATSFASRANLPIRLRVRDHTDARGKVTGRIADIRAEFPNPSPWRIDWADADKVRLIVPRTSQRGREAGRPLDPMSVVPLMSEADLCERIKPEKLAEYAKEIDAAVRAVLGSQPGELTVECEVKPDGAVKWGVTRKTELDPEVGQKLHGTLKRLKTPVVKHGPIAFQLVYGARP